MQKKGRKGMTKRFHICPQCQGLRLFMGQECFTCDGKGKVDPDAV